jgi:hypothetical protein
MTPRVADGEHGAVAPLRLATHVLEPEDGPPRLGGTAWLQLTPDNLC